ncbi:DUF7146 domain-containing protein [Mesorhizobium yinganensis]|uniref:DUF7146 domain-containing protein n=1 Tax=Mesorhizobium yinganensis TaxID=3157707 RepID=UPI0032B70BD9
MIAFSELDALTYGRNGVHDAPCPECGPGRKTNANRKRPVLRIWRNDPHFATYRCARCGEAGYAHDDNDGWEPGDDRDRRVHPAARKQFDAAAVDREIDLRLVWDVDQQRRIDTSVKVWNEAVRIRGTLAERYLRQHRQIDFAGRFDGDVLRFHPRCPWRDENTGRTVFLPALVAMFSSVDDATPLAIHRIALKPDGSKLDRRMLGISHRSAVRLGSPGEVLAISEGVETALAAMEMFPALPAAWACGSAGAVGHFPVLDGVKRIVLLAENNAASREACRLTGSRWQRARRDVQVLTPSPQHDDFNDALIAQKRGAHD